MQLVRQEGQAPPGGLVSDLFHHIFQGVDIPADFLPNKTKSEITSGSFSLIFIVAAARIRF